MHIDANIMELLGISKDYKTHVMTSFTMLWIQIKFKIKVQA